MPTNEINWKMKSSVDSIFTDSKICVFVGFLPISHVWEKKLEVTQICWKEQGWSSEEVGIEGLVFQSLHSANVLGFSLETSSTCPASL